MARIRQGTSGDITQMTSDKLFQRMRELELVTEKLNKQLTDVKKNVRKLAIMIREVSRRDEERKDTDTRPCVAVEDTDGDDSKGTGT